MAKKATKTEATDVLLEKLLRQFEEAFDQSADERERAERCRDYYDGFQWTDEEIQTLKNRKQPIVTSNRIKPKIDSLLGFEKRGRTDPKAYPRTPKHDKDADGATDAIRFVCDQNRFQQIKSEAAENLFIEGSGAATVTVKAHENGSRDVVITHVPWDRFYRDPHSRKRDFTDAKFKGTVIWMDEDDAIQGFPGKEDVIQGAYSSSTTGSETYDDRPKLQWADHQRKRIRVMQHRWIEKGVWHTAIICRGGWLRPAQPSPYLDEYGVPECDLIAMSAYVTRENERYGAVVQHLSAQDEINKRRSKALHRLSVVQVIAEEGAVESVARAKKELAKPDGYVEVRGSVERFQVRDGTTAMQGELELLREAKQEIDASGINPALEGNTTGPSGRAQEITQAAALAEQAVMFEALRDWSLRIYRASWNRIRQYWDKEKWIRVTDDEQNLKWVALNKPVTVMEEVQAIQRAGQPIPPELAQKAQINPQEVLRIENPVAELDVDILVEDGPDSVTIQSEQFEQLVELKKADPTAIPTSMVIEASSLRNKDRILEHLETSGVPPELQKQMQEMQQKLQEAEQRAQQAEQSAEADKQDAATTRERTQADIKTATAQLDAREARMEADQAKWELAQLQRQMALLEPPEQPAQQFS